MTLEDDRFAGWATVRSTVSEQGWPVRSAIRSGWDTSVYYKRKGPQGSPIEPVLKIKASDGVTDKESKRLLCSDTAVVNISELHGSISPDEVVNPDYMLHELHRVYKPLRSAQDVSAARDARRALSTRAESLLQQIHTTTN